MNARLRLACAAAALVALASPAAAQQAQNWSFESGSLDGWIAYGDAFADQPTFGNNVEPRRPGESPASSGDWWIGTYEARPSPSIAAGPTRGDGPTGFLLSPAFTIAGDEMSFLVGGGRLPLQEAVALLVRVPGRPMGAGFVRGPDSYYRIVRIVTGDEQEAMHRMTWRVPELRGSIARIIVVDLNSGPWGHINADDFRFSWVRDAVAPFGGPGQPFPVFRKPPPRPVISRPLPMPPGNFGDGTLVLAGPDGMQPIVPVPGLILPSPAPREQPEPRIEPSVALPTDKARALALPPIGRVVTAPPIDPAAGPAQPLGGGLGDPPVLAPRYRLIATGFRVRHQTVDDMLERDGIGDEVFVRADVLLYRDRGTFLGRRSLRSALFGQRGDILAGSGHQWNAAEEISGGLITNDRYPLGRQRFDTTPSPRPRDLPMVLWEGELQRGEVVIVIPSIWEWDAAGLSGAEEAWDIGLNRQAPTLRYGAAFLAGDRNAPPPVRTIMPGALNGLLPVFDDGTRPIGAARRGGDVRSGPAGLNPPAVGLTMDGAAEWVAASHAIGVVDDSDGLRVTSEVLLPPGAILITLDDPRELEGRYDLELTLERVN